MVKNVNNFIFIHIPRTGGTSIHSALCPFGNQYSFRNHKPAEELIEEIGLSIFQAAFSFTIVRNPWDRQVSLYSYISQDSAHRLHKEVKACSFEEYVKQILPFEDNVNQLQKSFVYSNKDKQLVDFVGRFEDLEEDFRTVCSKIGVDLELLKLIPSNHRPYRDYYDNELTELVGDIFEQDVKTFGYEF